MPDPGNEKEPQSSRSFRITSYDEGFFEPNGNKVEVPFSESGLRDWDLMTTGPEKDGRIFGEGQKLVLPSNPTEGYKISFGRQLPKVDVEVDMDIVGDMCANELAVSRQHFEISFVQGHWEVEDLGSTNGVNCHRINAEKSDFQNLKNVEKPWELQDGDALLIGGGPGVAGRIIGFRFYAPKDEQPYLVKYNAVSLDEMLSAGGVYGMRPELLDEAQKYSGDVTETVRSELIKAGTRLVESQITVLRLKEEDDAKGEYLREGLKYEQDFLRLASELGNKYYSGDWALALREIGEWAFKRGEALLRNKEKENEATDTPSIKSHLLVANKAMEISLRYIT